jgi:predicted aldo/keto reductase-like oxidoreductase
MQRTTAGRIAMSISENVVDRRDFLKTGLTVAATASLASATSASAAVPPAKSIAYSGPIPLRDFGKTGHRFPVLGHGGSAMMEREYKYYRLEHVPAMAERVKMVRDAFDKGVRYFDTARIYQESEQIIGEALGDVRDQCFIASKVLVMKPEEVRGSVETSLKSLKMDRIDCMQVHGPSIENLKYDGAMKLRDELEKLRQEGLFRFIGMTGHNAFDEMYKMIATGQFDQVLIEYGYFRKGYNTRHSETQVEWRENCLAKAHELKMGIVAMKVLGAWVFNHNAKNMVEGYDAAAVDRLPGAAIRWVLRDERVCVLNIGVSWPGDIDKNIAIVTGDTAFTQADRMLLADFSAKAYMHPSIQEMPVV